MEQTRGFFCTCDSGVTPCQSQNQYHFCGMSLTFEAYCTGKFAWQLPIKFFVIHEAMNGYKTQKFH